MSYRVKVIEPSGILDSVKGNQLCREVSEIVANIDIVLIDLKDIKFVDSSGLGALISSMQMVRNANGELFVCSLNDQVKMLFELVKMERVFKTFANKDEFNRSVIAQQ